MYLHAGNNRNLRTRNIIGIFDADTATVSPVTKKYLANAQAAKKVEFASVELPKSFVLYRKDPGRKKRNGFPHAKPKKIDRNDFQICFSQLSTASLAGRAEPKRNKK